MATFKRSGSRGGFPKSPTPSRNWRISGWGRRRGVGVLDGDLQKKWQPVRFPEESYAITELADFWLAAIRQLAYETSDTELAARGDALPKEFRVAESLADAGLAVLRDWRRQHGKGLLLLVDHLD